MTYGNEKVAFTQAAFRSCVTGAVVTTGACHDITHLPGGLDADLDDAVVHLPAFGVPRHVVHEPEVPRHMLPSQQDVALAAQLTERNRCEAERYLSELKGRMSAQGVGAELEDRF